MVQLSSNNLARQVNSDIYQFLSQAEAYNDIEGPKGSNIKQEPTSPQVSQSPYDHAY